METETNLTNILMFSLVTLIAFTLHVTHLPDMINFKVITCFEKSLIRDCQSQKETPQNHQVFFLMSEIEEKKCSMIMITEWKKRGQMEEMKISGCALYN